MEQPRSGVPEVMVRLGVPRCVQQGAPKRSEDVPRVEVAERGGMTVDHHEQVGI
jgi:hypothetical protein